jgi:pimeloyl-ACP methyl ester carboxylesterase
MHLTDRATNVLERLLLEPSLQEGPLILIGHSLGGLVIKQLLRTADGQTCNRTKAANLIQRVKKVAFLATPHTGSGSASWSNWLRIFVRPSAATPSLVRNDENLRDLNLWYRDWATASGIAHLILTETKPTRIFGKIVTPDSSDPGFAGSRPVPIDANHTEICKPRDRSSEVYLHVCALIRRQIEPLTGMGQRHLDIPATNDIPSGVNITYNITRNIIFNLNDNEELIAKLLQEKKK